MLEKSTQEHALLLENTQERAQDCCVLQQRVDTLVGELEDETQNRCAGVGGYAGMITSARAVSCAAAATLRRALVPSVEPVLSSSAAG